MNLKIFNIRDAIINLEEIKKLYEEAFPKVERYDFEYLIKKNELDDVNFEVIYDNTDLVAILFTVIQDDILYIQYIAVNSNLRGKGYGSAILDLVKEKYAKYTIILEIEEIDKAAENYMQRIKRKNFYEKNGFVSTNKTIKKGKNVLEIMTTNKDVIVDTKLCINIFKKVANPFTKLIAPFIIKVI